MNVLLLRKLNECNDYQGTSFEKSNTNDDCVDLIDYSSGKKCKFTENDLKLYIELKNYNNIKTIKNIAIFFAVLEIIGLIAGFIFGMMFIS